MPLNKLAFAEKAWKNAFDIIKETNFSRESFKELVDSLKAAAGAPVGKDFYINVVQSVLWALEIKYYNSDEPGEQKLAESIFKDEIYTKLESTKKELNYELNEASGPTADIDFNETIFEKYKEKKIDIECKKINYLVESLKNILNNNKFILGNKIPPNIKKQIEKLENEKIQKEEDDGTRRIWQDKFKEKLKKVCIIAGFVFAGIVTLVIAGIIAYYIIITPNQKTWINSTFTITKSTIIRNTENVDEARINRGGVYYAWAENEPDPVKKEKNYKKAIQDYNQGLELNHENAEAYYGRGNVFLAMLNDSAINDYTQAMRFNINFLKKLKEDGEKFLFDGERQKYDEETNNNKNAIDCYNKARIIFTAVINSNDQDAEAFLMLGNAHLGLDSDKRLVQKYYLSALTLNPSYVKTLIVDARQFLERNAHKEALVILEPVIEYTGHNNPDALMERGLVYFDKGSDDDVFNAYSDFNEALALDANKLTDLRNRGSYYYRKPDFDKSVRIYTIVIEFKEKTGDREYSDYTARGNAYFNIRSSDQTIALYTTEAIADYRKALEMSPDPNPSVFAELKQWGEKYAGTPNVAINIYNTYIDYKKDDADAFASRAAAFFNIDNDAAALADYRKAFEISASTVPVPVVDELKRINELKKWAETFIQKSRLPAAENIYKAIIDFRPDDPQSYMDIADFYLDIGNNEQKAINSYVDALKHHDVTTIEKFKQRAKNERDVERALVMYDAAITYNKNDTDALIKRGNLYFTKNNDKAALSDYYTAFNIDNSSVPVDELRRLVKTSPRNANFTLAETIYKTIIDFRSDDPQSYMDIGDFYLDAGNNEQKAVNSYVDALKHQDVTTVEKFKQRAKNERDAKRALVMYDSLIMFNSDDAYTFLWRAYAHTKNNDEAAAKKDYETALTKNRTIAVEMIADTNNTPELKAFERNIYELVNTVYPNDIEIFNTSINDNHIRSAELYFFRGRINLYSEKKDLAKDDFNESLKIEQNHPGALLYRGRVFELNSDYENAIIDYRKAKHGNLQYFTELNVDERLATALFERGKEFYERGFRNYQGNYTPYIEKLDPANRAIQDYSDAITRFEEAGTLYPQLMIAIGRWLTMAHEEYGIACHITKRFDEAIRHYDSAADYAKEYYAVRIGEIDIVRKEASHSNLRKGIDWLSGDFFIKH
jgi:tetratricopeptide (TPR) repeat protein